MPGAREEIPEATRPADGGNARGSTPASQSQAEPQFSVSAPKIELPKGSGAIRGIGEKFGANPATGTIHEDDVDEWRVRRYRPRIEGLFARIERWKSRSTPMEVHWRSISKDNVQWLYGLTQESRIYDPEHAERIDSWLICETRDDKGNGVLYRYKREDGEDVDPTCAHERNRGPRGDPKRSANRCVKRILYGNRGTLLHDSGRRPRLLGDAQIADADWMFEVVFAYADHDANVPTPGDDTLQHNGKLRYPWPARADTFSSYRSGFEIRTARTCRRVLMFHHFPGAPDAGRGCLVRSTDFKYSDKIDPNDARNPVYTGYRRANDGHASASMQAAQQRRSRPASASPALGTSTTRF